VLGLRALGQGAESVAPVAAEACSAEGITHGGRGVALFAKIV
jgi:hypothetical protein